MGIFTEQEEIRFFDENKNYQTIKQLRGIISDLDSVLDYCLELKLTPEEMSFAIKKYINISLLKLGEI